MNLKTNGGPLTKMCFLLQLRMKEFGLIIELVDEMTVFVILYVCVLFQILREKVWECEFGVVNRVYIRMRNGFKFFFSSEV